MGNYTLWRANVSPKLHTEKAKDLQSTSTLEQFMAKLCPHHQRQIVDALGFLQTEVKALSSTSTSQESNPTPGIQGPTCPNAISSHGTTKKACSDPRPASVSTPKDSLETELSHAIPISSTAKKVSEAAVSLKTSLNSPPPLDLRTLGSGDTKTLTPPLSDTLDTENRQNDHIPLKMKILKSNLADGKKLSCVLATSLPHSGTLEERLGNPDSNRTEAHSARLSPSLKKHSPNHLHQARQRDSLGQTKDTPAKQGSVLKSPGSIPPDSPRTARKTIRRSTDHRAKDSGCRVIADPDLGHCDIVYIDKPITECLREQRRCMIPKRNARKSTRGHMYIEEMWELKTVRTLTGRNERGNCPNPMPELITLVTPKQMLAKPDGVPPVDMPFAGGCGETIGKQMPSEESDEREIAGTEDVVETAVREQDLIIETSQTDQSQTKESSTPLTPVNCSSENRENDAKAEVLEDTDTNSRQTTKSDLLLESVSQTPPEAEGVAETPPEAESVAQTPPEAESVAETPPEAESVAQTPPEAESVAETPPEAESVAETPPEAESLAQTPPEAESLAQTPPEAESLAQTPPEAESVDEAPLAAESVDETPLEADGVTQTLPDVESVVQTRLEAGKVSCEADGNTEEVMSKTCVQPSVNDSFDEVETHSVPVKDQSCHSEQLQKVETFPPSLLNTVDKVAEEVKGENTEDEHIPEPLLAQKHSEENVCVTTPVLGASVKEQESDAAKLVGRAVGPTETDKDEDGEYDVSSKTLDALLKELPPWRRKRGTVISLPKRLKEAKSVIVGYVNGRPISASDRSLRRRSSSSSPTPKRNKRPAKSSPKVPKNASTQSSPSPKHTPEMSPPVTSTENTPLTPQVTEPSPEIPQASTSKRPIRSPRKIGRRRLKKRAKRIQQQITAESIQDTHPAPPPEQPVHDPQETGSKRPLRSAKLKPTETALTPPPANAAVSSSSPTPVAPCSLMSAEDTPSVPVSFPPTAVSPAPLVVPAPESSEESEQCTVQESSAEVNVAEVQSTTTANPEERQNVEMESRLQTKQKLRSAKCTTEIDKNEKQPLCNDAPGPSESERVEEIKMQTSKPLRFRRNIRKEGPACDPTPQNSEISTLDDKAAGEDPISSSLVDKPVKRPLRSESSASEMPHILPPPIENMKLALRSQRLTTPSTSAVNVKRRKVVLPVRMKPERITKTPVRSSLSSANSATSPPVSLAPFVMPRPEPVKQTHRFIEALNGEHNQQLLTNLNIKFDKMQKGWVQLDREGQSATKYRNKADRQAAIWKSKRRTRKPRSMEHQRYSPVQMLFMKSFDITSICRWFLESTETKSLVIVKKVNTRLPSETQLCFHSSSGVSVASQGVFPSLQAERLKKHLKKFAIASPVKSNPKSQKLIAKALEQEAQTVKGRERREPPALTQALPMPHCTSAIGQVQAAESQKASSKPKNPASARILRKYSNIREKMQVQHTSVRLKETPARGLKATGLNTLSRSVSKSSLSSALKRQKSLPSVMKQVKVSSAKMGRKKTNPHRKSYRKPTVQDSVTNSPSSGRTSRDLVRKDATSPQRCSQRLGTLKALKDNVVHTSPNKVDLNKKQLASESTEAEKPVLARESGANSQSKEPSQSDVTEAKAAENSLEAPQQDVDVKAGTSSDQVLTRSQRKMETTIPLGGSPTSSSRKASKSSASSSSVKSAARKGLEPTLTRSGTPKPAARKAPAPSASPSVSPKLVTKRAQEPLESPAKRTRMSHSK